jgi:2-dehydropantoate 2-reductase
MALDSRPPRLLVVGAGAIGGVVAAGLCHAGHRVTTLTTNARIAEALRTQGFRLEGETAYAHVPAGEVLGTLTPGAPPFDAVFLATQPPQVEEAARSAVPFLDRDGRIVCFQNGLCEERVARIAGRERVVGAVVAWGASMSEPGRYDRTSAGGFTVGRLDGPPDDRARDVARWLEAVGPVRLTENLLGARYSKLAINCAISTLGTIGGDRVGALMRHRHVRRLALEIMTETVRVAHAEGVRLEKVAGTVDLDWLALTDAERRAVRSPRLVAKHAVLLAAGFRYRRLRSSMLAAIERGRPPAVDFLNGEVIDRAERHGLSVPVNRAARDLVWQIARSERPASMQTLRALYEQTR